MNGLFPRQVRDRLHGQLVGEHAEAGDRAVGDGGDDRGVPEPLPGGGLDRCTSTSGAVRMASASARA